MSKQVDLLKGNIFTSLTSLAIPIMMTSVLQMAYNMIDMIWIGRISSDAVAAVGAAGMYVWLSNSFATLARMGGQVRLAQCYGKGDMEGCIKYATTTIHLGIGIGGVYALVMLLFYKPLISFFSLTNAQVIKDAEIYLLISGGLLIFQFLNQVFTVLITATGNSHTPFVISTIGLIVNMVLDPLLIFGVGFFPEMGVAGAAIATVVAQFIVTSCYAVYMLKDKHLFAKIKLNVPFDTEKAIDMLKISFPAAAQAFTFTFIYMIFSRMIASWGDDAIAVQKIGSQIESMSWMLVEGMASALNAFIAQNYGAKQLGRAKDGYKTAFKLSVVWGIIVSCALIGLPAQLFSVFLPHSDLLPMGISYLIILGFAQLPMSVEILTAGAFAGYGNTKISSTISMVCTAIRIPIGMYLGSTALGLDGMWWTITISCYLKGILVPLCFYFFLKNKKY